MAALLAVAQAALLATAIDGAFMGGLGLDQLAGALVALAVVLGAALPAGLGLGRRRPSGSAGR